MSESTATKNKPYWLIRGFDSTRMIYERRVGVGQITQDQIKALLKALAAKAGLTCDEIAGAYATRRTTIANDLLQVHKDGPHPTFSCGSNPFFVASISRPATLGGTGNDRRP
jgi:hypothetical protein